VNAKLVRYLQGVRLPATFETCILTPVLRGMKFLCDGAFDDWPGIRCGRLRSQRTASNAKRPFLRECEWRGLTATANRFVAVASAMEYTCTSYRGRLRHIVPPGVTLERRRCGRRTPKMLATGGSIAKQSEHGPMECTFTVCLATSPSRSKARTQPSLRGQRPQVFGSVTPICP
jgi:hypothetical protein